MRYIPVDHQKAMGISIKGFQMPFKMSSEHIEQFIEKTESVNPSVAMMYM